MIKMFPKGKSSIILSILSAIAAGIVIWAVLSLFWINFNLIQYLSYEMYSTIVNTLTVVVPTLVLLIPRIIKMAKKLKQKNPQVASTNQPSTPQAQNKTEVDEVVESASNQQPEQPQIQPKLENKIVGKVLCQCGVEFSSMPAFRNHQSVSGHNGTLIKPSETPPPTHKPQAEEKSQVPTQQAEAPKEKESLEDIEGEIKRISKLTDLEKAKAELAKEKAETERQNIVVSSLTKIRDGVNQDIIPVEPTNDLLTKAGPTKAYVKLGDKKAQSLLDMGNEHFENVTG